MTRTEIDDAIDGKDWLVVTINTTLDTAWDISGRRTSKTNRCSKSAAKACRTLLELENSDGTLLIHQDDFNTVYQVTKARRVPDLEWKGEIRIKFLSLAKKSNVSEKLYGLVESIYHADAPPVASPVSEQPSQDEPGPGLCYVQTPVQYRETGT